MNDDKLQKIEITLAHQDQQIQDLSEMINAQWKEIERLKLLLIKTQDKILELEASSDNDGKQASVTEIAASEKPPHY